MTLNGVLSCPWVVLRAVGGSCGELLGVKAGDGGACHCDGLRWLAGDLTNGSASIVNGKLFHVLLKPLLSWKKRRVTGGCRREGALCSSVASSDILAKARAVSAHQVHRATTVWSCKHTPPRQHQSLPHLSLHRHIH
jgi:hypothetical protein